MNCGSRAEGPKSYVEIYEYSGWTGCYQLQRNLLSAPRYLAALARGRHAHSQRGDVVSPAS